MTIRYVPGRGITVGTTPEMTFQSEDGTTHTLAVGEFADIIHQGRNLRIHYTAGGVKVEEINPKEAELKRTAAAVAKVMGWK